MRLVTTIFGVVVICLRLCCTNMKYLLQAFLQNFPVSENFLEISYRCFCTTSFRNACTNFLQIFFLQLRKSFVLILSITILILSEILLNNEEKSIILSIISLLHLQMLFVAKNVQCKKEVFQLVLAETCARFILKINFLYIMLKNLVFFKFSFPSRSKTKQARWFASSNSGSS